jgi:uncharacterized protein YjbI with pentapeptide repeats
VRAIAQAQTMRVLRDADPSSKQTVLLFLYDSELISKVAPIVDLSNADLSDANLHLTDSSGARLSGANLSGADLREADLGEAVLSGADLSDATGITTKELEQQAGSLAGAIMPEGSRHP